MEEKIETRATPERVWQVWEKALLPQERAGKYKYKIMDVKKGESFSMLWKSLFVKLSFTQSVKATPNGSEILYTVQIKGLFGWLVRWLLGKKIRNNIRDVLKATVRQLEI